MPGNGEVSLFSLFGASANSFANSRDYIALGNAAVEACLDGGTEIFKFGLIVSGVVIRIAGFFAHTLLFGPQPQHFNSLTLSYLK